MKLTFSSVRAARVLASCVLASVGCSSEESPGGAPAGGAGASSVTTGGAGASAGGATVSGAGTGAISAATSTGGATGAGTAGTLPAEPAGGAPGAGTTASAGDASGGTPAAGGSMAAGGMEPVGGNDGSGGAGGAPGGGMGGAALGGEGTGGAGATSELGFFVTSQTSETGNLGGLDGADATCQALAAAVGAGDRTWRAYLSAASDPENPGMPVHAGLRIGQGPWVNANGITVANDLEELHARTGDVDVFVDENGERINGQWQGSPTPNQHDMLTGSTSDGMLMEGSTCEDWTSESPDISAQVGHSDGLGPGMDSSGTYSSWNSSHENESCADTAPRGGAGRFYCFAAD